MEPRKRRRKSTTDGTKPPREPELSAATRIAAETFLAFDPSELIARIGAASPDAAAALAPEFDALRTSCRTHAAALRMAADYFDRHAMLLETAIALSARFGAQRPESAPALTLVPPRRDPAPADTSGQSSDASDARPSNE